MKLAICAVVFAMCGSSSPFGSVVETWSARGSALAPSPGVDPGLHVDAPVTISIAPHATPHPVDLSSTWTPANAVTPFAAFAARGSVLVGPHDELGLDVQAGIPGTRPRPLGAPDPGLVPPVRMGLDLRREVHRSARRSVGVSYGATLDVTSITWRVDRAVGFSPATGTGDMEIRYYRTLWSGVGLTSGVWAEHRTRQKLRVLGGGNAALVPVVPPIHAIVYHCEAGVEPTTCRAPAPETTGPQLVLHPWLGLDRSGDRADYGVRAWGTLRRGGVEGGLAVVVRAHVRTPVRAPRRPDRSDARKRLPEAP